MREGAAREAALNGAALQSITEAEMVAVFSYLTGAGGGGAVGGGQPSKLQKVTLVQAIVGGGAAGPEGQRVPKSSARTSASASAGDKGATAAPPYTAQHIDEGNCVASGGSAGGGAAGQEGDVANVGGQPLRLRVEAVTCLDRLKNSSSVCLVCLVCGV